MATSTIREAEQRSQAMIRLAVPRLEFRTRHTAVRGLVLLAWLIAGGLGGCWGAPTPVKPSSTAPVASSAAPVQTASPTPVLAQLATQPPGEGSLAAATQPPPTALPDPLRFTFPTMSISSANIWRPPLYDTPWEPTPYDHFYFSRPIGADEVNWPLAIYRYGGIFFENVVHSGIDIPAPLGTPVLAAGDGEVIWAGWGLFFLKEEFSDPYGLAIAIKHTFGYQGNTLYTIYGHMQEIYAIRGQKVKQGDKIGLVGETGKVTGPHLHFEVRVGENDYYKSRNPELWLAPPQGWGVLAARVLNTDGDPIEQQVVNIRSVDTNQYWFVITYGGPSVNKDTYYQENAVIGDLPAGKYVVWIKYEETVYDKLIEVRPGLVTYFRFIGIRGFDVDWLNTPTPDFIPPEMSPTPTITRRP